MDSQHKTQQLCYRTHQAARLMAFPGADSPRRRGRPPPVASNPSRVHGTCESRPGQGVALCRLRHRDTKPLDLRSQAGGVRFHARQLSPRLSLDDEGLAGSEATKTTKGEVSCWEMFAWWCAGRLFFYVCAVVSWGKTQTAFLAQRVGRFFAA